MKYIDLTHTLHQNIAVFPGDDPLLIDHVRTLGHDGFNDYRLTTGMHVGTHIDGPRHMTSDNRIIGDLPLDRFAGKGVLIDVRGEKQIVFRDEFSKIIHKDDILLFYSGLDKLFGTPQYFTNYPDFTKGFACFLAERQVKIVGLDWDSPDHVPYPIHNTLLKNNILILENLTNLDQILNIPNFEVFAFPLKIEADSSILRAVARVE